MSANNDVSCHRCPLPGADCPQGTSLATIQVANGFYRFGPHAKAVYPCPLALACIGSHVSEAAANTSITKAPKNASYGQSLCAPGYTHALCASCLFDHYRETISGECISCAENQDTSPWWVYLVVLATGIALAGLGYSCKLYSSLRGCLDRCKAKVFRHDEDKEIEDEEDKDEDEDDFAYDDVADKYYLVRENAKTLFYTWQIITQVDPTEREVLKLPLFCICTLYCFTAFRACSHPPPPPTPL